MRFCMRIGDLPPPTAMRDVPPPDQWGIGDRALLREIMEGPLGGGMSLQDADLSDPITKYVISSLQLDLNDFKEHLLDKLLPQLPPNLQQELKDLVTDYDTALKDVQDPKTQKEAADEIDKDGPALSQLCQNYM